VRATWYQSVPVTSRLVSCRRPARVLGTTGTPVAAGDGLLCITSGAQRLAGLAFDILGHANLELDPAALGIAPGETWLFQVGYRDPGGPGGSGFNFSDGLRALFTP
jgi:hypothetical protein